MARREAGEQLWRVQSGREPEDWKVMQSIASGAKEIRLHKPKEHRVIYVVTAPEGIYVLHAFTKKTKQTSKKDIEIARKNYGKI